MLALYQKLIPERTIFRINDFDGNCKLDVNIRETIGLSLWHYPNVFEREERKLFCSAIRPGATVLDVGANCGIYTLLAAKRGARVFSLEPDPVNASLLRHHVALNGFSDNVTVLEMAATDCDKTVPLYRNPGNWGASNLYRGEPAGMVQGRPLDALNLPPIDICKMDIEGSEVAALNGMKKTLARSPALKLFVEYNRAFGNGEPLLAYLKANFTKLTTINSESSDIPELCNILAVR